MKRRMTIYASGIVTRRTSKRATCAGCGADLGRRQFSSTGIPSMVASAMTEWLLRHEHCLACLRRTMR